MGSAGWYVVQLLGAVIAGFFAVLGALFLLAEVSTGDEEAATFRGLIARFAIALHDSPLVELPANLLRVGAILSSVRASIIGWIDGTNLGSFLVAVPAALVAVGLVYSAGGQDFIKVLVVVYIVNSIVKRVGNRPVKKASALASDVCNLVLAVWAFGLAIEHSIDLSPSVHSLLLALIVPAIGVTIADQILSFGCDDGSDSLIPEQHHAVSHLIGTMLGLSAVVTIGAVVLGSIGAPSTEVHIGVQALMVNLVCDTATMITFLLLLRAARRDEKPLSIGSVVLLGIAAALVLACLSLYLSFVGSPYALGPHEVLRVLFGFSPRRDEIELGAYFFLMHTTFLPVLIFLLILLLVSSARGLNMVTLRVVGLARGERVNPFRVLAAVCGVFVALFSAASGIAGIAKEGAQDVESAARISATANVGDLGSSTRHEQSTHGARIRYI